MKRDDREANKEFGWVLEMWGYTLGVLSLGIHHIVDPEFQCEPQGTGMDGMDIYPIYHYTFDLRFDNVWSVSKRSYHGRYFPQNYRLPPPCSSESHHRFIGLLNEATANLPGYQGQDQGGNKQPWPEPEEHWLHDHSGFLPPGERPPVPPPKVSAVGPMALTHAVVGTGPWSFGDRYEVFFLARGVVAVFRGRLSAVKGGAGLSGRWRFAEKADEATGGGDGSAAQAGDLVVALCGEEYRVHFALASGDWSFEARALGEAAGHGAVNGRLRGKIPSASSHAEEAARYPPGPLAAVLGAGPFAWAGMVPAMFLRGGVFQSPWSDGEWSLEGDKLHVTFYGIKHELTLSSADCGRLLSMRTSDRDRVPVAFSHEPLCVS